MTEPIATAEPPKPPVAFHKGNPITIEDEARSEMCGDLMLALAAAQGEMQNAEKDSLNVQFKGEGKPKGSAYADFASVRGAYAAALSKNKIAILQTGRTRQALVSVSTTLWLGGTEQWWRMTLSLTAGKFVAGGGGVQEPRADAHAIGSAVSYLKRFSAQLMTGVASEDDDDGNAAAGGGWGGGDDNGRGPVRPLPPRPTPQTQAPTATATQPAAASAAQSAPAAATPTNNPDQPKTLEEAQTLISGATDDNDLNKRMMMLQKDHRVPMKPHIDAKRADLAKAGGAK